MNYFNVGKIVNTQGLQGELRVLSVTDFSEERFKKGSKLSIFDDKNQFVMEVEIASHRKQKNFDIVKFKGLYHINDVEKYKGCSLKVAEEDLADLEEDEFYYHEIIGLDVYEGDRIEADKKSAAINIMMRSKVGTLNEEDVNKTIESILQTIKKKYNGEIRQ